MALKYIKKKLELLLLNIGSSKYQYYYHDNSENLLIHKNRFTKKDIKYLNHFLSKKRISELTFTECKFESDFADLSAIKTTFKLRFLDCKFLSKDSELNTKNSKIVGLSIQTSQMGNLKIIDTDSLINMSVTLSAINNLSIKDNELLDTINIITSDIDNTLIDLDTCSYLVRLGFMSCKLDKFQLSLDNPKVIPLREINFNGSNIKVLPKNILSLQSLRSLTLKNVFELDLSNITNIYESHHIKDGYKMICIEPEVLATLKHDVFSKIYMSCYSIDIFTSDGIKTLAGLNCFNRAKENIALGINVDYNKKFINYINR